MDDIVGVLSKLSGLFTSVLKDCDRARDCDALLKEIQAALEKLAIVEKDGKRKTLVGEFTATAPDGTFSMTFYFQWGNQNGEGYRTDSKNSLNSMDVSIDRWYSPFESE